VFTFVSFKTVGNIKSLFFLIAMALWGGLGAITGAGYEVAATTQPSNELHYNSTGNLVLNVTKSSEKMVFLPGGEQGLLVSYIFYALTILCFILIVKHIWKAE
jgi:hypothetical protein